MTVDERDFWGIMVILALLGAGGVMQARITRRHEEAIIRLRADVQYLMDTPSSASEAERM